jgi:organic hydroperoxide reductase OsmC/OhrA
MPDHLHRYRATCWWSGSTGVGYDAYDRHHRASAPPAAVDLDLSGDAAFGGDSDRLNPEALLVTAAASCQLLSFLAVAARARLDVVDYRDEADAVMPSDDRPMRITEIHLNPRITVRSPATSARVEHLCQVAHRECYIANSVRSTITVTPTVVLVEADG